MRKLNETSDNFGISFETRCSTVCPQGHAARVNGSFPLFLYCVMAVTLLLSMHEDKCIFYSKADKLFARTADNRSHWIILLEASSRNP